MIWTTPTFEMEPDHPSTLHSDRFRFRKLPHSNVQFHVTPILQARALAVAAAYVRSLGGGAAHLLGSLCPSECVNRSTYNYIHTMYCSIVVYT